MFPDNNQPSYQPAPQQQQPVQQQQQPQYQQPAPQQPNYSQPAPQDNQPPAQYEQPQSQPTNDPSQQPAPGYGYMPDNSDFNQAQNQQVVQQSGDNEYGQPNQQAPVDQNQQQQPQGQPTPFTPTQNPQTPTVQNITQMETQFDSWLDTEYPMPDLPNINDIAADDPEALANFFVEYDQASRGRAAVDYQRRELKEAKEEVLWQEVHTKYGNLRHAPNVMNTVKQMYEGARSMGNAVTPLQVVDQYVTTLNNNFQRGYQANNTQVQIRQSQPLPNGGGNQTPPTPVVSQQDMSNLNQNGNDVIEDAAAIVRKMRAAGHGGF